MLDLVFDLNQAAGSVGRGQFFAWVATPLYGLDRGERESKKGNRTLGGWRHLNVTLVHPIKENKKKALLWCNATCVSLHVWLGVSNLSFCMLLPLPPMCKLFLPLVDTDYDAVAASRHKVFMAKWKGIIFSLPSFFLLLKEKAWNEKRGLSANSYNEQLLVKSLCFFFIFWFIIWEGGGGI